MPNDWREATVRDLADLLPGRYLPRDQYVESGPYYVYGSNSVMGRHNRALYPGPLVIMAAIGAYCGAVRFSADPVWVNNNAFAIRAREGVNTRFLYYWLESLDPAAIRAGTGQPYVQRQSLLRQRVRLPPLEQQHRIASLLESVDEAASAAAAAVATAMTTLTSIRMATLDDLRDAPSVQLSDVSRLSIGRTPPRKDSRYWTSDVARPFCTIADMTGWQVDPNREGITDLAVRERRAKPAPVGALLMSFKLTIGRVGFAARELFPNEAIVWLDLDCARAVPAFVAHQLASMDLAATSSRAAKGATLNSQSLAAIELRLPSLSEQIRAAEVLECARNLVEAGKVYEQCLSRVKKSLLADLLSGGTEASESYGRRVSASS